MSKSPKSTITITHDPLPEQIESMHEQIELSLFKGISPDEKQQELLHAKPSVLFVWDPRTRLENITRDISSMKSMNEDRYLCVSNGLTILCLDLHQNRKKDQLMEYSDEIKPLPIQSKLVLPTVGYPVAMGMFNLGSDAYMVGGHTFPAIVEFEKLNLSGNLFKFFYFRDTFEAIASLETYSLSLVEGSLSLSRCDTIKPLNEPKFWPIVEKVDNQLHVIESFPPVWSWRSPHPTTPSHEVLEDHGWTKLSCFPRTPCLDSSEPTPSPSHEVLEDHGWTKFSCFPRTPCLDSIGLFQHESWFSLVVGDRIYSTRSWELFDVFDSTTQKWELYEYDDPLNFPHLYSIKHIAELLKGGFGRCIGEYRHADYGPLYVVIGVGEDKDSGCIAAAYLVTRTGQVVYYQRLPSLFGSFGQFCIMGTGTLISTFGDEGETYCAIVPGYSRCLSESILFIATFTVEDSLCAHLKFPRSILSKGIEIGDNDRLPYEGGEAACQPCPQGLACV